MAPTHAQATEFGELKVKACSMLRGQVRDEYAKARDGIDRHGRRWKWGADYYRNGGSDDEVWKDFLRQWDGEDKWNGYWRLTTLEGGCVYYIGPTTSFLDAMVAAGRELAGVDNIEDMLFCLREVVEGLEKGGIYVRWRSPA